MKKIISLILCVALVLGLLPSAFAAGTATVSISASSAGVTAGSQVSFKVNISGAGIGSYQYTLNYDASLLEYVGFSGDGEANGAGGAITALGEFADQNGVDSISTTVTFKAKQVGNVTVSLSRILVVDNDTIEAMSTGGTTQCSISIAAKPEASTDNTLKSLSVSPSGLTPEFSSAVTEYSMQVEYATSKLVVSATPNHSKAKVSVSGSGSLAVGDNTVKIVVTAESGATKTYVIKVNRKASDYSGVTVVVDGVTYSVAYDIAQDLIPEGYTPGESTVGGKKMVTFSAPGDAITIARLVNGENVGAWYIYNAADESFSKLLVASVPESDFVILDMPADQQIPEGFSGVASEIEVAGVAAKGYAAISPQQADFYLVYAMDKAGAKGLYLYDKSQGTLQRYMGFSATQAGTEPKEEDPDPTLEPEPGVDNETPLTSYALLAAAVLLFAGGVVLLVVLLRKPTYKPPTDEDEEEFE